MKIIRIYFKQDVTLVDYELNGHFNTMPLKLFKKYYKI